MLDNQLPALSRDDHRNWNLLSAVEGAPPVAGARPQTFGEDIEHMKIHNNLNASSDDVLERYRPTPEPQDWDLVASGFWSEDMYHSGHIAYFITRVNDQTWVLDGVERNAELDGITEEDVEEGRLNDDQLQAIWGMSLEEAQSQEYRRIVVVIEDAPHDMKIKEAAALMYAEIRKNNGKIIEEPDIDGLLEI